MPLYLRDARFVHWDSLEIQYGHFRVDAGPFGSVEQVAQIPSQAKAVDCRNRWVTRAFSVAHHHIYSALARGMPAPLQTPTSFVGILEHIWWHLDKRLDLPMIRASALATAVDAARAGTAFIIDHHASPFAVRDSLFTLASALEQVGLGHLLCYELSDRDGEKRAREGLEETEAYLSSRAGLVGLHASFTVGDALLKEAVHLAEWTGTGLHVHVAEAESDQAHCEQTYGCRVVERLHRAGGLEFSRTILAHCLHLSEAERALVAGSEAWVAENVESNQNNAVGRFDDRGLGDRILIGTDGMHSDALMSARAAFLQGQPGLALTEAYRRLRNVHRYTAAHRIPGDGENNLVVLDYDPPTPVHSGNWLGHLFYALHGGHVESLIAQGKLILHQRELVTVSEQAVLGEARAQAERLWGRWSTPVGL